MKKPAREPGLTLTRTEIDSLTHYFGVITKEASKSWNWEIIGAPLPIPEISTVSERSTAVTNCQFYHGGCYLIVEACGADKFKVLKNNLAQEYLNGVTKAAHILTEELAATEFYGTETPGQKIKLLEREVFAAALAAGYPIPAKKPGLMTYYNQALSAATNFKKIPVMSKETLRNLKLQVGIIENTDGGWYSYVPSRAMAKRYWKSPHSYIMTTWGDARAAVIKQCHSYSLPLIVEKIAPDQYAVVYNNQRNEYLRGLVQGFAIMEAFFKSMSNNENYHTAIKYSLAAIKEIVNTEREMLGFKKLKNQAHYYGFEVLKWRKGDEHKGLQNSC